MKIDRSSFEILLVQFKNSSKRHVKSHFVNDFLSEVFDLSLVLTKMSPETLGKHALQTFITRSNFLLIISLTAVVATLLHPLM